MKVEAKHRLKKVIANSFGTLGYLTSFLQWLWATILYLSLIQSTTTFINEYNQTPTQAPTQLSISMPGPLGIIILGVTVVVMIAITVYAIIAVPRAIVKTSNKVVHKTAEAAAPLVMRAQHKKESKRLRLKLTTRLVLVVKVLLVVLPLILTAASKLLDEQFISYSIALIAGSALACVSIVFFALQYILALAFKVKPSDIK